MTDQTGSIDTWRKSSYSNTTNNCVEVAQRGDRAAVRDTKDRDGGLVATSPTAWRAFLHAIR